MTPATVLASKTKPKPPNAAVAGIGMMLLGVLAYSLNDALGKWLASTYSVSQIMFIRGAFATAILLPFLWRAQGIIRGFMERPALHILRMVFVVLDVGCFYFAVATLPLATVMTYYLAGPIYVTALSPFLLGERIGWRRWSAVAAGFVGVVIALEPSDAGLGLAELSAFVGSLAFALLMITTRKLRGSSQTLLVGTQVAAPMFAGAIFAPLAWITPSAGDFALIGFLGIVSMVASLCVNRSLKLAPASTVVPYQYTFIIWAVVFGYIFFGDTPQMNVLIGAAIIVGAGLFIFLREQKKGGDGDDFVPSLPSAKDGV